MFYLGEIIGLKVTDIRGFEHTGRPKPPAKRGTRGHYDAQYILFDDGKTIIELEEQDPYTYHDASHLARLIHVRQDKGFWEKIKSDLNYYPPANWDTGY